MVGGFCSRAVAATLLLLPAYAQPQDPTVAEADGVEACDAQAGCGVDEDLALSLRQLRATARHDPAQAEKDVADAAVAEKAADGASPVTGSDDDYDPGLPGGWGEAADFADKAFEEEQEAFSKPNATLEAQGHWGSCAHYKCPSYYVRGHHCQCNGDCARYGSCCKDHTTCHNHHAPAPAEKRGHHGNIMKLYHQTGSDVGPLIIANGFKPGTQGWCGGGIYFAMTPEATETKAIGPDSHKGFLIEATVDVGKVKQMPRTCDRSLNHHKVHMQGFDSVSFNPGDGVEYIVYKKSQILSVKQVPLR